MAKYRQVHVSFWQDSFVLDLPTEEKFFYLYLMTNSKTTQCGIYELPLKVVEMETGLSSDRIFDLLYKFVDYKRIMFNEDTREVMLLNWLKHNKLTSGKVMTCAIKEIESIKHIPFVKEFLRQCELYKYPIDTLSIPYLKGLKPGQHPYGEEKEEEKEQEEKEEREEDSTPAPLSNPNIDHIQELCTTCNITDHTIYDLEQIASFVGMVDMEVIEAAIKKSTGKKMRYVVGTIKGMVQDGITKKEDLAPKMPSKVRQLKPHVPIVMDSSPTEPVADDEYERILAKAREMDKRKEMRA